MNNQGVKYYDRDATPLKFHVFFKFVSCPLLILLNAYFIWKQIPDVLNVAFKVFDIILLATFFIASTKWRPMAWVIIIVYEGLLILDAIPSTLVDIFNFIRFLNSDGASQDALNVYARTIGAIGGTISNILILVYYFKRKNLFTGIQTESVSQTIDIQKTIEPRNSVDNANKRNDVTSKATEVREVEYIQRVTEEQKTTLSDSALDLYDDVIAETKENASEGIVISRERVRFCRKCGTKVEQGALFCRKCGAKL